MKELKITGIIKHIGEVVQVSEKFKKRDVVITIAGQYPQHIQVQVTQDRVDLFKGRLPGDEAICSFNLKGHEWTSPAGEVKCFNTIEVWKVE